jgi:thiol-disulfide isomerase/thioredoxin
MSSENVKEETLSVAFLQVKYPKLILKFSASWCGPCKNPSMLEKLHQLADTHAYHVEEIDIDKHGDLCEEYKIQAVPTFIIFDESSSTKTIVGGNMQSIEKWIMRNKMSDN